MAAASGFLRTYRVAMTPAPRLERVLAIGRAFLAVTGLFAIFLDPTEPARMATLTYGILSSYAIYSLAVVAWTHRSGRVAPGHGVVIHGIDIVWTSCLTFVSDGSGSPFFLFFLFLVAASAYRWGFRETVATAVTTAAIFLLMIAVATAGPWRNALVQGDIEVNRTIIRVAYLLLAGFLLGYLAEQEKQSRAELSAIADLPRALPVDFGLRRSVTAVAESLLRAFDASGVAMVLQEHDGGVASLWTLPRVTAGAPSAQADRKELDADGTRAWLGPCPAMAWHIRMSRRSSACTFRCLEQGAWSLETHVGDLPMPVRAMASTTVTGADMGFEGEWRGRIYLFDIADPGSVERAVHFLADAARHVTPILTNVFLLRQLRLQDTAAERARVARELHDGAIQALFGIDMKVEALRRHPGGDPEVRDRELEEVQEIVRREVLALRDLMRALKPIELDANEKLSSVLANVVERFRRDSGVQARFVVDGDAPSIRPSAALEVVRILQEALVNIRKHSRANNVIVRLTQVNGHHILMVEDDGTGFAFEGRLTAVELDARRLGPTIIKERARILGASLVIHSTPGAGSRLEVTLGDQVHG